ncbi:MAG TPA: bifunctional UDP-N-acetylglucosamine diphosphorylase/glucosamine-1-phosphate N-acetyltransferase GlmU [Polyangiales bacterium]|nr:bifunctional UDP-N-acetylglucosamine diphosphorylase/glucosamine-1-phosphate N-acetyltransferase GlmU [Polyangiales bacterium]
MTEPEEFVALVLAAGQGKRMRSSLPKVAHPLLGRPMLTYPVDAALAAGANQVVCVIGHGAEQVSQLLAARYGDRVRTALQPEQRGTGDAARCGAAALPDFSGYLVIVYGDSALITSSALGSLLEHTRRESAVVGLLTSTVPDATGYGRIIRDASGRISSIREQRDCSPSEAALREFNPGVYAIQASFFRDAISQLTPNNAQGELYLTDLVALAAQSGRVAGLAWDAAELHGINDRAELAERERDLALRVARQHMQNGVTLRDPNRVRIEPGVAIEPDAVIGVDVELRGETKVAARATIDVGCVLTDVVVQEGAQLLPYCVAAQSVIGPGCRIGPFANLRPGSELAKDVHIGNFVETKQTKVGEGSKANHLSYLGNGVIGKGVNVGAGTIFCNYDGYNKYTTTLDDGSFIGSDSQLVAPVTVGKNAYVGTGTTVTMDVPEDALAIGRARQENKPGLGARLRAKLKAKKERK